MGIVSGNFGIGEVSAGGYIGGAATAAVAGYLSTPQGKEAVASAITLVTTAVNGLADKLFSNTPPPLPANPDDFVKDHGYTETSHPEAPDKGHRTFDNEDTGAKVRHDKGKPGQAMKARITITDPIQMLQEKAINISTRMVTLFPEDLIPRMFTPNPPCPSRHLHLRPHQ